MTPPKATCVIGLIFLGATTLESVTGSLIRSCSASNFGSIQGGLVDEQFRVRSRDEKLDVADSSGRERPVEDICGGKMDKEIKPIVFLLLSLAVVINVSAREPIK